MNTSSFLRTNIIKAFNYFVLFDKARQTDSQTNSWLFPGLTGRLPKREREKTDERTTMVVQSHLPEREREKTDERNYNGRPVIYRHVKK